MTRPNLTDWQGEFALPPFDAIRDADFAPAIEAELAAARAEIAAIADNPAAPDFANTIEALEYSGEGLGRVLSLFYVLTGADSSPAREALSRELAPKLSAYHSEIVMNRALYQRIEAVWDAREGLDLSDEQQRLLYLTRRGFRRAGAALEGDARERMVAIKSRLATLGTQFGQNLLADERDWVLPLEEADLAGLPAWLKQALNAAGKARDLDGPALTLARSVIVPFLQFCPDRALRRRAHAAWAARGAGGGETDNREIAAEILALRAELAQLLGHDSYAGFKLETEMAGDPQSVEDLLMQVWKPARAAALEDAETLTAMLRADGVNDDLAAWDWRYYAERLRRERHDLDEAALKPHFALDNMIAAAFSVARRLFGLEFRELDAPLYHGDARAWEVTRDGRHMAVFIGDYFARPSKRSGAWCTVFRKQQKRPVPERPIVLNVCNFAQPEPGAPALLSFDDARTLFHEFGHALHQILSDVSYGSISGTSVARDFVELPSQLYEHWLELPEVLDEFARHAETGAKLPEDQRDRLLAATTHDTGFATVEYLGSALVDLAFHRGTPPSDPMARQAEILEGLGMPAAIGMRHATPHFAHVFSGDGYASGYYSYMWSEVMDADAFEAFREAGSGFDADVAQRLEAEILSVGGSVEAAEAYTAFRGRMPGVEPLLKGRGLLAG